MVVDLDRCIGCGACAVACTAENNVAVVGKDEVGRDRAMHWLRVDSYLEGEPDNPVTYFQPRLCMHCELAPCEYVCPVHATVHSHDGLNDMVYNRCVGTRYCSNNCPYKVRRFNFLEYSSFRAASLKQRWNPEVTVRSRGVMEKCTFCVQRIRAAEIQARTENRRIAEGEVMTACQQACPTGAIVFGDLNDPNSHVARLKALPLNYAMLGALNTRPRTTYLAIVRNPNPGIDQGV
jgi:molybdopterin-containing oxidoreductase family iron-sulfur binding subunit